MKIYMPSVFPEPLMQGWGADVTLDVNRSGYPVSRAQMQAHLHDADAAVINLDDVFDREMCDAAPNLRVLSLFAESTYNIDLDYAHTRGITVCVTPGEIFENTADLTFALLMSAARRIVEADSYIRGGNYHAWGPATLLGGDIYGKTIGIIGMGTIGRCVALRAKGFGMRILYTAAHGPKHAIETELGAQFTDKQSLLRESDFVCLHCKLTDETYHIIGADEIAMMKPTAYLINTGRGKLIDEPALARALADGGLAGAGLDVFEDEPAVTPELLSLPNVVLTPHLGASSLENRMQMARIAAADLRTALMGGQPRFHA